MTKQKKNRASKTGAETLLSDTNQNPDDITTLARVLASLIIGLQPLMDISMLQLALEDVLSGPLDEESAQEIGEQIFKKCKVTIPTDGYGSGPH